MTGIGQPLHTVIIIYNLDFAKWETRKPFEICAASLIVPRPPIEINFPDILHFWSKDLSQEHILCNCSSLLI